MTNFNIDTRSQMLRSPRCEAATAQAELTPPATDVPLRPPSPEDTFGTLGQRVNLAPCANVPLAAALQASRSGLAGAVGAGSAATATAVTLTPTPASATSATAPPPTSASATTATAPLPTSTPTRPAWAGPILDAGHLGQKAEDELLRALDTKLALLPYGAFDPNKKPVILIHGYNAAPQDLRDLAERLTRDGRQVMMVVYEDETEAPTASGQALARALADLRARYYEPGTPLDIVAHSMGGLVTRSALNDLQQPGWLEGTPRAGATPRAGFGVIRLRTVETPWVGFAEAMSKWMYPITRFFMRLFHYSAAAELVVYSDMYSHLYEPKLAGVEIMNTAAHPPYKDDMRSLPDFEPAELCAIVRFIESQHVPDALCARNMALALAQDARFAALGQALREERAKQPTATDGGAAALVTAYERVMPRALGEHTTVLVHREGDPADLVDRLARELSAPSAAGP